MILSTGDGWPSHAAGGLLQSGTSTSKSSVVGLLMICGTKKEKICDEQTKAANQNSSIHCIGVLLRVGNKVAREFATIVKGVLQAFSIASNEVWKETKRSHSRARKRMQVLEIKEQSMNPCDDTPIQPRTNQSSTTFPNRRVTTYQANVQPRVLRYSRLRLKKLDSRICHRDQS
jgi:hypothetical protein